MKKHLLLSALLLASLSTTFVSCKKDDKAPEKSRKDLITGTWTVKGVGKDANSNGALEVSEYDSVYKVLSIAGGTADQTFAADGTGQIKASAFGKVLNTIGFKWSLQDSDKTLRLSLDTDTTSTNATISKLDEKQFEFQQKDSTGVRLFVLSH